MRSRADETIPVVSPDYSGVTAGNRLLVLLKPITPVNTFELLDFALHDRELLVNIETTIRATGGHVTRGPRS